MRTNKFFVGLASTIGLVQATSTNSVVNATSASSSSVSAASSTATPGYFTNFTTITNSTFDFGQHYAVLNLDLMNAFVLSVASTNEGAQFISSTAKWIDAVHAQSPAPLSIFTRIYFLNHQTPEIGPQTPFATAAAALGDVTAADNVTMIYPAFTVKEDYDVVLQKTRYYAGYGNELESILRSQLIDTVILVCNVHATLHSSPHISPLLPSSCDAPIAVGKMVRLMFSTKRKQSGIRTSGVILNTVYQLFNDNYKIYVIVDNCIEMSPNTADMDRAIKEGIIPKLPVDVITLEQALGALNRSGPAIY